MTAGDTARGGLELMVVGTEGEAAVAAAAVIVRYGRDCIAERGRFRLALSGGRGPEPLFRQLARQDLDWSAVELYQVDERIAPEGSDDRNLTLLQRTLAPVLDRVGGFHPMPVDDDDVEGAALRYGATLSDAAGNLPVLDLVHLGIGPDGHTASLVPGDPVLDVVDRPVAVTGRYQGHRRMTLTFPVLDAARRRLWYVTDPSKQDAVRRLLEGDPTIPAARVRSSSSTLVVAAPLADA